MFVVTVGGGRFLDKHLWTDHKVIGVYETKEEALQSIEPLKLIAGEEIALLTDLDSGEVTRIDTWGQQS